MFYKEKCTVKRFYLLSYIKKQQLKWLALSELEVVLSVKFPRERACFRFQADPVD